jgi:hypothetical protein
MAGNDAAGKFFEAINASSDALIDVVRATNDRGHRVSTAIIEAAQEGQRETVELVRKWAAAPLDLFSVYSAVVETTTKAQSRTLDVTRQWFGEMADAQKETRQYVERVMNANRVASEASIELARGAFSRATEAVQSATEGNGRRMLREPARAAPESHSGEI